jgi:hypothetical protein
LFFFLFFVPTLEIFFPATLAGGNNSSMNIIVSYSYMLLCVTV